MSRELQRQLDEKGHRIRRGVVQDVSLIEADPGPSGKPRKDGALTRRVMDGDWAKRRKSSVFDYEVHVKTDRELGLIRDLEAIRARNPQ